MTPIKAAAGEVSREEDGKSVQMLFAQLIINDAEHPGNVRIIDQRIPASVYDKALAAANRLSAPAGNDGVREALERLLAAFKGLRPFPLVIDAEAQGLIADAERALSLPQAREAAEPEVGDQNAAYAFRETLIPRADTLQGNAPLWHGWAVFDAFIAGAKHGRIASPPPIPDAPGGREEIAALTKLAAECHRSKWQFDFNDENRLRVGQARDMVKRAFGELHRIGDLALKLRDALKPQDGGEAKQG